MLAKLHISTDVNMHQRKLDYKKRFSAEGSVSHRASSLWESDSFSHRQINSLTPVHSSFISSFNYFVHQFLLFFSTFLSAFFDFKVLHSPSHSISLLLSIFCPSFSIFPLHSLFTFFTLLFTLLSFLLSLLVTLLSFLTFAFHALVFPSGNAYSSYSLYQTSALNSAQTT